MQETAHVPEPVQLFNISRMTEQVTSVADAHVGVCSLFLQKLEEKALS